MEATVSCTSWSLGQTPAPMQPFLTSWEELGVRHALSPSCTRGAQFQSSDFTWSCFEAIVSKCDIISDRDKQAALHKVTLLLTFAFNKKAE